MALYQSSEEEKRHLSEGHEVSLTMQILNVQKVFVDYKLPRFSLIHSRHVQETSLEFNKVSYICILGR